MATENWETKLKKKANKVARLDAKRLGRERTLAKRAAKAEFRRQRAEERLGIENGQIQ